MSRLTDIQVPLEDLVALWMATHHPHTQFSCHLEAAKQRVAIAYAPVLVRYRTDLIGQDVWTDYPRPDSPRRLRSETLVRTVTFLGYDGNKYVTVRERDGLEHDIKAGYIHATLEDAEADHAAFDRLVAAHTGRKARK